MKCPCVCPCVRPCVCKTLFFPSVLLFVCPFSLFVRLSSLFVRPSSLLSIRPHFCPSIHTKQYQTVPNYTNHTKPIETKWNKPYSIQYRPNQTKTNQTKPNLSLALVNFRLFGMVNRKWLWKGMVNSWIKIKRVY